MKLLVGLSGEEKEIQVTDRYNIQWTTDFIVEMLGNQYTVNEDGYIIVTTEQYRYLQCIADLLEERTKLELSYIQDRGELPLEYHDLALCDLEDAIRLQVEYLRGLTHI